MRRMFFLFILLCLLSAAASAEIVGRTHEDYIHRHIAGNGQAIYFLSMEEEPSIHAEDVNFDGMDDLVVCTAQGASNAFYEFFVFDGAQYVLAGRDGYPGGGLANYALHPEKGLVSTQANNGYAGLLHDAILFRWEGTKMVEVRRALSDHTTSSLEDGDVRVQLTDYGNVTLRVTEPAYDSEGSRDADAVLWEYAATLDDLYGSEQQILQEEQNALWRGL